jgi:cell wall-associated NlpC family hydrolase
MESTGVVTDSVANLYSKPDTRVDLVTQAIVGTGLSILESQDGWQYVQMPDQYQAWIEAQRVRLYAPDETAYASTGRVVEISSLLAYLYHVQAVSARAPARQVPLGARLEVADEFADWIQVALPDGAALWVQRGDVVISKAGTPRPRGSVQDVVATAKRLLGLPYLWGGTTPLGIDCSGLVQLAYRLHGVQLLRDSHLQYSQPDLTPVEKEGLQTGDLVFFGRERITHVGLVIGGGEFIHATTHQRPIVQISHLDEAHWTELYWGARRP